jgi:hypothetical protein
MANVINFIDGFDHYQPSTQWFYKWNGLVGNAPGQVTGRFGVGQAIRFNVIHNLEQHAGNVYQAWRFGFGLYLAATNNSNITLIALKDGSSSQVELGLDGSQKLRVTRNGTLVGSASTNSMASGTWMHVEWYIVITDTLSSGNCTVKVNGTTELSVTSGDTKNTSSAQADRFTIGGAGNWDVYFDDFVATTMDVTTTPTFLGDRRVTTLYPDGNGNYSDFDGSDGNQVNNYQLVDEGSTVSTSDYVESATVTERDSYTFENPSVAPATIHALQLNVVAAKSDAGSRTIKPFFRIGGSNYDGSAVSPASSPTDLRHLLETSPATSTAWTSSELNGLEAGVKVEA